MSTETARQIFQGWFDKAVAGLAAQDWQASTRDPGEPHEECAYRSGDGRRCAVGHLIPDRWYNPALEGQGISALMQETNLPIEQAVEAIEAVGFDAVEDFLVSLQSTHDDATLSRSRTGSPEPSPDEIASRMQANLRTIAQEYGLTLPPELEAGT